MTLRILCYGEQRACEQWHQILVTAGMTPLMTRCHPPSQPSLRQWVQQNWDAAFVQRGLEDTVLSYLAEAARWQETTVPLFILGGDIPPSAVADSLQRGAMAVLGNKELACLPQMLQLQSRTAYLELLVAHSGAGQPTVSLPEQDAETPPLQHCQELDNLIMSISLYAELLMERIGADSEAAADIQHILVAASRANELTRSLRLPKGETTVTEFRGEREAPTEVIRSAP